jgi:hypothetical protein
MLRLRNFWGASTVVTAAAILILATPSEAAAADSEIYTITTTSTSATIVLTPLPLNACNAMVIWRGDATATPQAQEDIVWTGTDQLLSHDPTLANTFRFSGLAQQSPQYFEPRTVTVELSPGTYTILGQCTPYDAEGNYAGDDSQHTKSFSVSNGPTEPIDPGDDAAWGSLENLIP